MTTKTAILTVLTVNNEVTTASLLASTKSLSFGKECSIGRKIHTHYSVTMVKPVKFVTCNYVVILGIIKLGFYGRT